MSVKRLILAWASAIIALGLFCAFVLFLGANTPLVLPPTHLDNVETVVIGSSMTHAAIPAFEAGSGLFKAEQPYKLLLVVYLSEEQSVALFDDVSNNPHVSTVIIEANDFIYDIDKTDWLERVSKRLKDLFHRGRALIEGNHAADFYLVEGERPEIGETMNVATKNCNRRRKERFSFFFKSDSDKLAKIVSRARDNAIDIVLFVPPLSECYDSRSPGTFEAINHQANVLSGEVGIRIWKADAPWENGFFSDTLHLNFRGRERFLREFETWLQYGETPDR